MERGVMSLAKKWSLEEINELDRLAKKGLTITEISKTMNRSRGSVSYKLQQLEIKTITKREWTDEEENRMIELLKSGMTRNEVSKEIDRSASAISARLIRLGLNKDYRGWRKTDIDKLKEMLNRGMNYQEIAKSGEIDKTSSTIRSYADNNGLKPNFHNRKCIKCGSKTKNQTATARLCKECIKKRDRKKQARKRHIKDVRKRERARGNGGYDSSINLKELYKRDKAICHICNEICDVEDFKYNDNGTFIVGRTYPTTDHVIPIAKGGQHSWDNVKLAHHYCNAAKTDMLTHRSVHEQVELVF